MEAEAEHDDKDEKECVICFDTYEDDVLIRETHCHHLFHEECLVKWIEKKLMAK